MREESGRNALRGGVEVTRADVIVVGGGPAGSTLALRLARAGWRTLVVEARCFPRHKPCGEFMSPEALPILEELGVREELEALGARRIRGMRLHGYGRDASGRYRAVGKARAPFDHGYALRRERFDQTLLDAARRHPNVRVLEGHRVTGLVRGADGRVAGVHLRAPGRARAEETCLARATIGADGVHSTVARGLGLASPLPWLSKTALVTRFELDADGDQADVHFFDGGYFVACPVEGGVVSVNLVVDSAELKRERSSPTACFDGRLDAVPALAGRLRAGRRVDPVRGVAGLAVRTARQTFQGGALVGDAAGYVDPITGEGIFFALAGARALAEALVEALALEPTGEPGALEPAALSGYVRRRGREIVPRARMNLVLQRAMRSRLLLRGFLRMLEARPRLADLLVGLTGDYVPLRELARPSVWAEALQGVGSAGKTLGTGEL